MIKKINNKKYILTDIFDTLVTRKVEPEYVKKIWSKYIVNTFEINGNVLKMYEFRNLTERKLTENQYKKNNEYEFKYIDLIKEIYDEFNLKDKNISFDSFYSKSKEIEIEIEYNVQIIDKEVIKSIKKAKEEGKKIVCISDMYFNKEMIESLFSKHDILYLFDKIYVSSEYMLSKRNGTFYDFIIKDLKVKPEECLMIGDNKYSDYENPKSKNIDAVLLDRSKEKEFYSKFLIENSPENIYKNLIAIKDNKDDFDDTIYSLYLFIERLYFKLIRKGSKSVFFLSREGEFLKKLFDLYQSKIFNKKLDTNYVYVSRKSTYLPSLKKIEEEKFDALLLQYFNIKPIEFLKSLNFNEQEINKVKASLPIDYDKMIVHIEKSDTFKKLISNKEFRRIYSQNRIEQKNNFIKYINDFNSEKDINLVDIGWKGSIQNNISNILEGKYNPEGYYFGLINNKKNMQNKNGLIFNNNLENSKLFSLYHVNTSIYEIVLGASHGSANKYVLKNNKIEVECYENEEEENMFNNYIKPLQERMYKKFERICDLLVNGYYDNVKVEKYIHFKSFKILFNPSKKQLALYDNFTHYENFGLFETVSFNIREKSLIRNLKERVKLVLKRGQYFGEEWPALKMFNYNMLVASRLYIIKNKLRFKKRGVI